MKYYISWTQERREILFFLPWGYNLRWCIITLITFNGNTAAVYASHEGCEGNAIVVLGALLCTYLNRWGGKREWREGERRRWEGRNRVREGARKGKVRREEGGWKERRWEGRDRRRERWGGRWREGERGKGGREGGREEREGEEEECKEKKGRGKRMGGGEGYVVPLYSSTTHIILTNCGIRTEAIDNNTAELKCALSWGKHK